MEKTVNARIDLPKSVNTDLKKLQAKMQLEGREITRKALIEEIVEKAVKKELQQA